MHEKQHNELWSHGAGRTCRSLPERTRRSWLAAICTQMLLVLIHFGIRERQKLMQVVAPWGSVAASQTSVPISGWQTCQEHRNNNISFSSRWNFSVEFLNWVCVWVRAHRYSRTAKKVIYTRVSGLYWITPYPHLNNMICNWNPH